MLEDTNSLDGAQFLFYTGTLEKKVLSESKKNIKQKRNRR